MSRGNADQNRRILIIDDNHAIHDDFRKILAGSAAGHTALDGAEAALFGEPASAKQQSANFEVDSAFQGAEGLAKIQQAKQAGKSYAMAFVDVRMPPGWDGIETTEKIWEVDPDLQVVLCTAYSDYSWDEMINRLHHPDRLLILKKPFDTVEALQLAHALTEKWRLTQAARQKLDDLDRMVAERTLQLEAANTDLQAGMAERERTALAMRESEERFRCLSACSPVGIMLTDTGGRCTYANPHCRTIFGEDSLVACLADGWLRFVHAEDRAVVATEWMAHANTGQEFKREVRLQWKSGEVRWVQVQSAAMLSDAGANLGYVVSIADVTERRRAQETLRRSEEHFRTLIENASDIIRIVDASGKIRYASPAVERVLGYRPEELVGQDVFALVHPDDQAQVTRLLGAGMQPAGLTTTNEYRLRHKDGSWRMVESVTKNLIQDETVHGVIITSRDITDRRQAEEQLHLRGAALESVANSIVITQPDGTIVWVNPAFTQMTGYTAAEVVGQNPRVLKSGKQDQALYQQLWQTITAGQSWHGELTNRRKDGTLYTEEMTITPVCDQQGAIQHFVAIQQDVSSRKRLEEQYRQAQKMEAVGKLAGGVAHDFNNILTAIMGYSELTLRAMGPDEPRRINLEEIKKAAERAAGLTRQLLAFSRKQALQPKVLTLSATVSELERMLQRVIGEDIELVTISHGTPGQVRADPGQIEQVIMNLAVNARDAMPGGGKLTIETSTVTLDEEYTRQHDDVEAGKYVRLAVADTGTGMKPEVQARLFEPFFTTKEVGKGTGLGLATCYGIIKQSGGHLSVVSELGRGSTFQVFLPLVNEAEASTIVSHAVAETPRGKETLLMVEDDLAVRGLAAQVLRGLGYTVLEAANGTEALREVEKRNGQGIDLIVTDVIMPQMGGKELIDQIHASHPEIKVLFSSGYTGETFAQQGILDAGIAFLAKPYTPATLARRVREMLNAVLPP